MFPVPKNVLPVVKYIIHIEYSDGTKGDVDLSHLAGKGVFAAWDREGLFDKVHLHNRTHAVRWNDEIEICPDSLYLKIKGLTFNEWKKKDQIHAQISSTSAPAGASPIHTSRTHNNHRVWILAEGGIFYIHRKECLIVLISY